MRKPDFCLCENKDTVTALLISTFVFATRIEQCLFFLNLKAIFCDFTGWFLSDLVRNPNDLFSHVVAQYRDMIKDLCVVTVYTHLKIYLYNQRTIGPENAHQKPDLGVLSHNEMTLTLNTHTPYFISCLHLQSFRSQAAIVSKPSDF